MSIEKNKVVSGSAFPNARAKHGAQFYIFALKIGHFSYRSISCEYYYPPVLFVNLAVALKKSQMEVAPQHTQKLSADGTDGLDPT